MLNTLAESGTVVLPWQLAAVLFGGGVVIILCLAMQLRDKADRDHQRAHQLMNSFRDVYTNALKWARKDYEDSQKDDQS